MYSDSESEFEDDLLCLLFLHEHFRARKALKKRDEVKYLSSTRSSPKPKKIVKKRRYWVNDKNKERESSGEYQILLQELESDEDRFLMYFRMYKSQFEEIHSLIESEIKKENTHLRKPIGTRERLAVCLRFLATGDTFRSIGLSYRMGFSTVRTIVKEVCEALWKHLGPIVMLQPTAVTWKQTAADFNRLWNFPNCIGVLGGKHINMKCPINSGSDYWNHNGHNSIVLLALVDTNKKFVVVDVGPYGTNSDDGGILEKSTLGKLLNQKKLNIPEDQPLMPESEPMPYVIIGDESFPLKDYLLRPYSKNNLLDNDNKMFNYRLSRAKTIVEDTFRILRARWRVFLGPLQVQPEMVEKVVLAACCLHNFLGTTFELQDETSTEPTTQQSLIALDGLKRNHTQYAYSIREKFKRYFASLAD